MKRLILKTALLACAAIAGNANAVAVPGQGSWETTLLGRDMNGNAVASGSASAVFLYDTVLDVTWLRDANANGAMTWSNAVAWANSLNGSAAVGGSTGWRLPTMIDTGDSGCDYSYSGTDCGHNVQTKTGNLTQYQEGQTVYSEMASLFYDTLGNKSYYDTAEGEAQLGWGLTNTGDFQNMQSDYYWSGLGYAPEPAFVWYFVTIDGNQNFDGPNNPQYALAVRDGDVLVSAVPEPETYALMLAGLGVVGFMARRRKAK